MVSKVRALREQEKQERERLDAQTALLLEQAQRDELEVDEWVSAISAMLAQDNRVNMTVYMFAEDPEGGDARTVHFQDFELMRVTGGMSFNLSHEVSFAALSLTCALVSHPVS
jgi:hypothetical protein